MELLSYKWLKKEKFFWDLDQGTYIFLLGE